MAKKKNIKLTEHISYCIIDSTIYLFQNNINLSENEIEILYKKLTLIIEDNGIGINNSLSKGTGIGSTLINSLVAQIEGTYEIDSKNGTKVSITFKNKV